MTNLEQNFGGENTMRDEQGTEKTLKGIAGMSVGTQNITGEIRKIGF